MTSRPSFAAFVAATLFAVPLAWAAETWKTAYPPNEQMLDPVITQELAKKFKATLVGDKEPFARRLLGLETGSIDLMSGLLKTPEREQMAYFLNPAYKQKSNKYFFVRKGEGQRLQKYEDLYKLTVGVNIESKYFPQFDNDEKLTKHTNSSLQTRFQMLIHQRLDAVVHTDVEGLAMVKRMGLENQVEVAPYRYEEPNPVYLAISLKSPLIKRKDELEKTFRKMVESGEIDKIMRKFYSEIGIPMPDYK